MKKSLFMIAAAALAFTACTNDELVSQNEAPAAAAQEAVGFDVYVPGATQTRAGLVGTMTTTRLQRSEADGGGFGVYAYLTEDANATAGEANATAYNPSSPGEPNFMVNEKILWNNTNLGWYYNPLKYWPNETDHDSQNSNATMEGATPVHLDRLTFFAYAPYVSAGSGSTGITAVTDNAGKLGGSGSVIEPTISWRASDNPTTDFNPNQGVDLLWGVAPAGGLSYTAVNGWTVTRNEGTPLLNMIKPDVNTSMKFLFQHALARFGFTVVAAVDQVAAGGQLDPNTKITINSLKITGPFGTGGDLNLDNGVNANIANWTKMTGGAAGEAISSSTANLASDKAITVSTYIADNLKYAGVHTFGSYSAQNVVGVTTAKQDLLDPSTKWFNKLAAAPVYNPGKKYVDESGNEVHATYAFTAKSLYYTLTAGQYTQKASGTETAPDYPAVATTNDYYTLTETGSYIDQASQPAGLANDTKMYTRTGAGTPADPYVYAYSGLASAVTWDGSNDYYTVEGTKVLAADIPFTYSGDIYEAERNYIYVVPTNNVSKNAAAASNIDALRTITVQIEYYITTEDSKINGGRTQTKNVITKEVVLPSLQNGKTYNLNMVLGLTSVKIEAEVDDWKVVNSQVDLPQNTAE